MSSGVVLSRVLLLLISGLVLFGSTTSGLDSDTSTARSTTAPSGFNLTSYDVLDVRTPPRFKLRDKTKTKRPKPHPDDSHPGVAIPLDARIEVSRDKSTTSWILLTGRTVPTSTTKIPTTGTTKIVPTQMHQKVPNGTTKVVPTQIQQMVLNGTTKVVPTQIQQMVLNGTTKVVPTQMHQKVPTGTTKVVSTQMHQMVLNGTTKIVPMKTTEAPIEAKEASINLDPTKKPQVGTTKKKKKNKTRKRKPQSAGTTDPIQLKETIGNQFYSYLSREVVPTLGVGLVGLVVTAGLAGYFLYHPFGALAKSDAPNIDRAGHQYHHQDRYYYGVPEEEAIGEVIAGMTGNAPGAKLAVTGKKKYRLDEYRASTERGEGYRIEAKNGDYGGSGEKGDLVKYQGDYGASVEGGKGYEVGDKGDLVKYQGDYGGFVEGGDGYKAGGKMGDLVKYQGDYGASVEGGKGYEVGDKGDYGGDGYNVGGKMGDSLEYRGDFGGSSEGVEGKVGEMGAMRITEHGPRSLDLN